MNKTDVLSGKERNPLYTPSWQQQEKQETLLMTDIKIKNIKQKLEKYKNDMQGLAQFLYEQKMFSHQKIKKLFGTGKENEKRVKEFQKYIGTLVDGKFGPKSFAKLKEKWISLGYKDFGEAGKVLTQQEKTAYEEQLAADKKKYGATAAVCNYNPGNMKCNGDLGRSSKGYGVFSSPEKGYQAMLDQIEKIKSGESKRYNPEQSLAQIRCVWTQGRIVKEKVAGYKSWAKNVLKSMGKTAQEAEQLWNTLPIKDIPTEYIAEGIALAEDGRMYDLLNDRGIAKSLAESEVRRRNRMNRNKKYQ